MNACAKTLKNNNADLISVAVSVEISTFLWKLLFFFGLLWILWILWKFYGILPVCGKNVGKCEKTQNFKVFMRIFDSFC